MSSLVRVSGAVAGSPRRAVATAGAVPLRPGRVPLAAVCQALSLVALVVSGALAGSGLLAAALWKALSSVGVVALAAVCQALPLVALAVSGAGAGRAVVLASGARVAPSNGLVPGRFSSGWSPWFCAMAVPPVKGLAFRFSPGMIGVLRAGGRLPGRGAGCGLRSLKAYWPPMT